MNGWNINPVYAHRTTPIGYRVSRADSTYTNLFDTKREAVAFCRDNAEAPKVTRLVYVNGKRTWVEG